MKRSICSLLVLAFSMAGTAQSTVPGKAPRAGTASAAGSSQSAAPAVGRSSPTPAPVPNPGSAALSSAPISSRAHVLARATGFRGH